MNIKNKLSSLMYAPLALALLAACSSDDVVENNQPTTQGQTLTINATTGGEDGTRTIYGLETGGKYEVITSKWDKANDKVIVFGNSKNTNKGEFKVSTLSTDGLTATLTGTIPEELTDGAWVNAYIANDGVVAVNSNNQLEVDYSEQDGTWLDAVKKSVLYGKTQYSKATNNNIPNLEFKYMTAFFKLTLKFPEISAITTANLCITGDKLASKSRINTVYNKGGGTNKIVDAGSINIKNVTIKDDGEAVIYFALYPQTIKNTHIQAELEDGSIYTFEVIPANKEVQINNGYFYQFGRTGTKIGNKNQLPTKFNGAGTKDSPYEIGTILDLMKLQNDIQKNIYYKDKYFKMTSDITINGEWEPIGNNSKQFRGTFDGDRHTISGNIKVSKLENNNGIGLFGLISDGAVVKNLTNKANIVADVNNITGTATGSIVGRLIGYGTVENCKNTGNITSNTASVGGIVGQAFLDKESVNTTIEACSNEGDIINNSTDTSKGSLFVGGIIGTVSSRKTTTKALVVGCYNKDNIVKIDNVERANAYAGGIAGSPNGSQTSADNMEFKACWNSAQTIYSKNAKGDICGTASKTIVGINTCWTNNIKNKFTNAGVPTYTNCANSSTNNSFVELKDFVSTMNTAWGSTVYKFDTNGNIVK